MNKKVKVILCAGIGCVLALSATACGRSQELDPETRALRLSIGALDGNFNPFFSTSQFDSEIAGFTQIGLITTDEDGELAYGEKWPTATLDYKNTMYTTKQVGTGNATSVGTMDGRTEYEFLLKNDIKFSDGVPLTIKDVLFNLYVYLDPEYTGLSTVYSTDIQGMKAYRAQNPALQDDEDSSIENDFYNSATVRRQALINWSLRPQDYPLDTQGEEDLATVKELFEEEATSDWTTVSSGWKESFKDSYTFTETWQAYLFQEQIIRTQTATDPVTGGQVELKVDAQGNLLKDRTDEAYETGKYLTTLDPNAEGAEQGVIEAQHHIDGIAEATTDDKVDAYIAAHPGATRAYAVEQLQREYAIDVVVRTYTDDSEIATVLQYFATASKALEEFASDERGEYYDSKKENGQLAVDHISGISTYKTTNFNGKQYDEEHDVLKIVINGVDPKAIWNFGFSIAPMHYYSGTWRGKDYVAEADPAQYKFGLEMGDPDFFKEVLKNPDKSGLPVGAGAYKASSASGSNVNDSTFFSNNIVYFERNTYFETVGKELNNAKIKYVNYQVMSDDRIVNALTAQEVDFATPNATPGNQTEVQKEYLTSETYLTGGYGYVGINPKYVPDHEVRQAIMKAMNTRNIINNYYTSALASTIWRPVSLTSWANPEGATEYDATKYTSDDQEIVDLVEAAKWVKGSDGLYHKNGKTLEFTFTIAGESTDHPAYRMFTDARDRLNSLGFKIEVKPDIQALKKLSSGSLAVWAAAWSTGIDPDMYQTYHKDSRATSVENWYYSGILHDTTGTFTYEAGIIELLSQNIDAARETLNRDERTQIYATCYDLIMQLAVELPTYQRNDLSVYNNTVIDRSTCVAKPSHNMSLIGRIWEVNYI